MRWPRHSAWMARETRRRDQHQPGRDRAMRCSNAW
jgi:hypothetical protein